MVTGLLVDVVSNLRQYDHFISFFCRYKDNNNSMVLYDPSSSESNAITDVSISDLVF